MTQSSQLRPNTDDLVACQQRCLTALFGPPQSTVVRSRAGAAALPTNMGARRGGSETSRETQEDAEPNFDGRYRIVRRIADGGTATVFEAEHLGTGRTVALKVLSRNWMNSGNLRQRFVAEARITSGIVHANVVEVLDAGVSKDGLYYVAMEYIDGEPLSAFLDRHGAMEWRDVRAICLQLASGLERAHAQGVIHRDLKPENIVIVRDDSGAPTARIIDFGLAQFHGHSERTWVSHRGQPIGSAPTMSPEQVRGEAVTAASDIYALGCVMHRMLVGSYPLQGATFAEFAAAHLHVLPDPLPDCGLPKSVHLHVGQLIHNCLCKDPAQRFQSMADLRKTLLSIPDSGEHHPIAPIMRPELRPEVQNRRLRSIGMRASLVVVAAIFVVLGFLGVSIMPIEGSSGKSTGPSFGLLSDPPGSSARKPTRWIVDEVQPPELAPLRNISESSTRGSHTGPGDQHAPRRSASPSLGAQSPETPIFEIRKRPFETPPTPGQHPGTYGQAKSAIRRSPTQRPRSNSSRHGRSRRASNHRVLPVHKPELIDLEFVQHQRHDSAAPATCQSRHAGEIPGLLDPLGAL